MIDISAVVTSYEFIDRLAAAAVTGIIALLFRFSQPKADVKWGTSHGFAFTIPNATGQNSFIYYTRTVFVQNVGRGIANQIEVHFNFKPEHFQMWPTFTWSDGVNPENKYAVKVPSLGKREYFTIEMISIKELPMILRVRTQEGECKEVPMAPQQLCAHWMILLVRILIILGVFAIVQNAISLFH